jgi:uncharacterized SAM-binding protein YcdF (DUF218 family)
MVFLIVLLVVLLLIGILLFSPLPVKCVFYMDNETTYLKASLYDPFFKLRGELKQNRPVISVRIFNIRVWQKALGGKREKGNGMEWVRAADVSNIQMETRYSLMNPFATGLASGFVGIAASMANVETFEFYPDFISLESYIHVEAAARINIGNTMVNFAENKRKSRRTSEWSKA